MNHFNFHVNHFNLHSRENLYRPIMPGLSKISRNVSVSLPYSMHECQHEKATKKLVTGKQVLARFEFMMFFPSFWPVSSATVNWYQGSHSLHKKNDAIDTYESFWFRMRQIAWIVLFISSRTLSVSMEHHSLCSRCDGLAIKVLYTQKTISMG